MKEQVIVLAAADEALLGALRCMPGLVAGIDGTRIWLRGIPVAGEANAVFLKLPALDRYMLGEDNLLFLPGAQTPQAYLPKLKWKPVAEFVVPEMPVAAFGGILEETISVELVSSEKEERVSALLCPLEDLQIWVNGAAEVRISALRFAAAEVGMTLVMGEPLPTIPGAGFWDCQGLLLPAGHQLQYPMLASTIRRRLDPDGKYVLIFQSSGEWERIPRENMLQATRSGIRQTQTQQP